MTMRKLVLLILTSLLSGLLGIVLICTAFFTGTWLKVYRIPEVFRGISTERTAATPLQYVVEEHGLWDYGVTDLNCRATPFSVCMYTRAALSTEIVLAICGIVLNMISAGWICLGGRVDTSGTFARAAGIVTLFANIAGFIGVLLFTLQYTICIASCPPLFTYYPTSSDNLSFGWSFMVAWIGIGCLIGHTSLLFIYSCLVEARYAKISFSPNRNFSTAERQTKPEQAVYS